MIKVWSEFLSILDKLSLMPLLHCSYKGLQTFIGCIDDYINSDGVWGLTYTIYRSFHSLSSYQIQILNQWRVLTEILCSHAMWSWNYKFWKFELCPESPIKFSNSSNITCLQFIKYYLGMMAHGANDNFHDNEKCPAHEFVAIPQQETWAFPVSQERS